MVYSVATRENVVAVLDTATQITELCANSPGTVDVPQSSMLTAIYINAAPQWTADAHYGFSSAIRLSGSGISGYQSYPGPCGGTAGLAVGSCGFSAHPAQRYKTRIPVIPGQGIDIEGFMHGEDIGDLQIMVTLEFDGVPGMIKDMDYRECDLTTVNTPVVLGTKLGAAYAYIQPSSLQIGEIHVNAGVKQVGAAPLGAPTLFELFGAALPSGGLFEFCGHAFAEQDDTGAAAAVGGAGSVQTNSVCYTIPRGKLPLKAGNKFQCQATMIEDDVGTLYAIMGIGYL